MHQFNFIMESYSWTHLPLGPHICVGELGLHWFRKWLVAWTAPSHNLNQYWHIVNHTPWNIIQWNSIWNSNICIQENAFEHAVCEMAAIFSKGIFINIIHFSQHHPGDLLNAGDVTLSILPTEILSNGKSMTTLPEHWRRNDYIIANRWITKYFANYRSLFGNDMVQSHDCSNAH